MPLRVLASCAILGLALVAACTACGGRLVLGQHPWAVGVQGRVNGDGTTVGVEAGGWLFGVSIFADIGPLETEDGEAHTD